MYARGVAVFQRLLGVTLGKSRVKQTKLRGFPLFLGRASPKTQQKFISPLPERYYCCCCPERHKLFKLHMFLCSIVNMQRSSAVFTHAAARIPTAIYTSVNEEGALRWSGASQSWPVAAWRDLQGGVLSPATALSNLIVSPSDNRLGLHPASPNALLRSQSFHTTASPTPAVLTVSCTCGTSVARRYGSPQTPSLVRVRWSGSLARSDR